MIWSIASSKRVRLEGVTKRDVSRQTTKGNDPGPSGCRIRGGDGSIRFVERADRSEARAGSEVNLTPVIRELA